MLNHEIIESTKTPQKLNINCEDNYNKFIQINIHKDVAFHNHKYNIIYPNQKLLINNPQLKEKNVKEIKKIYYGNYPLKKPMEYNAFFPQSFYFIWEIINKFELLNNNSHTFLFFDDDKNDLGHIEATIKFCENNFYYESNEYIRVLSEKPKTYENKKFESVYGHCETVPITKLPNIEFAFLISLSDISLDIFFNYMGFKSNAIIYIKDFTKLKCDYINNLKSLYDYVHVYQPIIQDPLNVDCFLILISLKNHSINVTHTNLVPLQNQYIMHHIDKLLDLYSQALYHDVDETIIDDSNAIEWAKEYNFILKTDIYSDYSPSYVSYSLNKYSSSNKLNAKTFDQMHKTKRKLNEYKQILTTKEYGISTNHIDDIIDMNKLNSNINFYGMLNKIISWKCNGEMVNSAWTKIYEIISREKMIDHNMDKFKSFHLCEISGSNIFAINHYIKTETNIKDFEWYANYHASNDTKCKLIDLYPNNWVTDQYGNSDLKYSTVIDTYVKIPCLSNINLVICDGSNYVSILKQTEQELMTSRSLFFQIYTLLHTLSPSGNAIIKIFLPLVESMTISILYLLVKSFAIVKLVKPISCHADNSEIYCICKSYNGIDTINHDILIKLDELYNKFDGSDSIYQLNTIDIAFINSLTKASESLTEFCIEAIKKCLYLRDHYYHDYDLQKLITKYKEECINKWINDTQIKEIKQEDKLIY